jgi:peptidoglycan hydrolase-like protein with peptidoglycan-binding domain
MTRLRAPIPVEGRDGPSRSQPASQRNGGGHISNASVANQVSGLMAPRHGPLRPTVRRGAAGSHVEALQRDVSEVPGLGVSLTVDGVFGRKTDRGVRAFQRYARVKVDGIVGPQTWSALIRAATHRPITREPDLGGSHEAVGEPARPAVDASPGGDVTDAFWDAAWFDGILADIRDVALRLASAPSGGDGSDADTEDLVAKLKRIFDDFNRVEVTLTTTGGEQRTVEVRIPYFINTDSVHSRTQRQAREQPNVRAYLRHGGTWWRGRGLARVGKSSPKHVRELLELALDAGLIDSTDSSAPTAQDLEGWLRNHGIGVDCSGFVSQALNQLMEATGGERRLNVLLTGSQDLSAHSRDFDRVERPADLRPAQTMFIEGARIDHIRIIGRAWRTDDGSVRFTTYESRGGGEARHGMDEVEWRYPRGERFEGLERRRAGQGWVPAPAADQSASYGAYRRLQQ